MINVRCQWLTTTARIKHVFFKINKSHLEFKCTFYIGYKIKKQGALLTQLNAAVISQEGEMSIFVCMKHGRVPTAVRSKIKIKD